jgi:hypothetical protein
VRGFFALASVRCIARTGPAVLAKRRACVDPVPACLVVERLRGHVEAARPRNRSGLRIDFDAREGARVIERFEDAAPLARLLKSISPTVPSANVRRSRRIDRLERLVVSSAR